MGYFHNLKYYVIYDTDWSFLMGHILFLCKLKIISIQKLVFKFKYIYLEIIFKILRPNTSLST